MFTTRRGVWILGTSTIFSAREIAGLSMIHNSLLNTILREHLESLNELLHNLRNWNVHNLCNDSLLAPVLRHDLLDSRTSMICSTTCGNPLRDTFLRNDPSRLRRSPPKSQSTSDVERVDIVRKRACPSPSEEILVIVRRKVTVPILSPPKSPETTLKTTSSMRGRGCACNPSPSEVPAVVVDEAAGLGGVESLSPHPQWECHKTHNHGTKGARKSAATSKHVSVWDNLMPCQHQ